jgi:hypothetical protein
MKTIKSGNVPEKHSVRREVHTMERDELWIPRMSGTNLKREKPG